MLRSPVGIVSRSSEGRHCAFPEFSLAIEQNNECTRSSVVAYVDVWLSTVIVCFMDVSKVLGWLL